MHDFVSLEIAETRRETDDALLVTFSVPGIMRQSFSFRPGQHLAVKAVVDGEERRRTYSICSGPDDQLTITIKRVEGGLFSNWAFDRLRPGMLLDVMPPAGRFVLPEPARAGAHFLAIAGGVGITPIMAMAEHAMRRHDTARFTLVYGNRDAASIVFRERLEDLKDACLDRFTLIHVLSRNEESDSPLLEGRITPERVTAFAGHLFDVADIDDAFLCGPGTMIRDVRKTLMDLGLPRERIHHEFFAPSRGGGPGPAAASDRRPSAIVPVDARESVGAASEEAQIVAIVDGLRHRFAAHRGEAVIDAALRAGVRVPYSCKAGMCSTCRARLVEGHADMRVNYSLEPWELEKGFILTCQAIPRSSTLTIDFDQV